MKEGLSEQIPQISKALFKQEYFFKMKKINKVSSATNLSRRDALKKAGKYAAFTAIASLVILSPKTSQADSPPDPGWGK
jgi:hypothetical protein